MYRKPKKKLKRQNFISAWKGKRSTTARNVLVIQAFIARSSFGFDYPPAVVFFRKGIDERTEAVGLLRWMIGDKGRERLTGIYIAVLG